MLYAIITLLFLMRVLLLLAKVFLYLRPVSANSHGSNQNTFAIFIPVFNEEVSLSWLLPSLERIDFPIERWSVYFILDQKSSDNSEQILQDIISKRERWFLLKGGHGKAENIRAALELCKEDFVGIFDADCEFDENLFRSVEVYCQEADGIIGTYSFTEFSNDCQVMAGVITREEPFFVDHLLSKLLSFGVFYGFSAFFRSDLLRRFNFEQCEKSDSMALSNWLIAQQVEIKTVASSWCRITVPSSLMESWNQRRRWSRGIMANYSGFLKAHNKKYKLVMAAEYLSQLVPIIALLLIVGSFWKGATFYVTVHFLCCIPVICFKERLNIFTRIKGILFYPCYLCFLGTASLAGYFEEIMGLNFTWYKYPRQRLLNRKDD